MWQTMGCNVHRAAATTALFGQSKSAALKGAFVHQRVGTAGRAVALSRTRHQQVCTMSYPQALQDPAAAPRSNRVYTHFAVRLPSSCLHRGPQYFKVAACVSQNEPWHLSAVYADYLPDQELLRYSGIQRQCSNELQGHQAKLVIPRGWCIGSEGHWGGLA